MSKDNTIDIEKEKQKDAQRKTPQPPPMYKVLLNNDDYTPMDFVIEVLMHFFNNQLFILVEDLLVVYFVKVVKIDLIFVLYNIVDKTMPSVDIFRHWRRNILNL